MAVIGMPPPYLRFMCSSTLLWMIFQVRRCSARARGSPSRAARAISRSSFRWLASRSWRQRPVGQRGPDGAARLAVVAAIAEPARRGDVGDVVEGGLDALLGAEHLERPDAWRVDQQRAAGQLEQLAMGRRVPAARVGVADLGRRLAVLAEQGVDQRRLADARRAEDRGGRPGSAGAPAGRRAPAPVRAETATVATPGAIASTATSRPSTSSARSALLRTTTGVISLDHGDREVALDPAQVEVVVEAGDEQGDVDVRGHDLLVVEAACRAGCCRRPSA